MIFKQVESGGDRNYAYIIASEKTGQCAIVDPSPDASRVLKIVKEEDFSIKYVINTHLHFDHSQGNSVIRKMDEARQIKFVNCDSDSLVKDGETITMGKVTLEFILTPGHTPESICVKVNGKLITGDTLFVGKVGGTYGRDDAESEFESLKKLLKLPPETEVWPGHNYGIMPGSTIGFEKEHNPFIKRLGNFSEFLWLKQNWAQYKAEHGIK